MKTQKEIDENLDEEFVLSLYSLWSEEYNSILDEKVNFGENIDPELYEERKIIQ